MAPKRVADVFDDSTSTVVNTSSDSSLNRESKRKRTSTEKVRASESNTAVGAENTSPSRTLSESSTPADDDLDKSSGSKTSTTLHLNLTGHQSQSGEPVEPDLGVNALAGRNGAQDAPPESSSTPSLPTSGAPSGPGPVIEPAIFEYRHMSWFPAGLDARLRAMLAYQKPAEGIYSLSTFPEKDLVWGQSDTSMNKLCKRGSSVPVVVWVIGLVASTWFFDHGGNPHNKVSLGVTPLTPHAMNKGRRILSQHARPPQNIESWVTHLSASRWQSMRLPKRRDAAILPFDRCYNATTCFESKTKMATMPIENIKGGDLVLMEANIGRYSVTTDKEAASAQPRSFREKSYQKSNPTGWKPTFDLRSVSLLCAAPDDPDDAQLEDVVDTDDRL